MNIIPISSMAMLTNSPLLEKTKEVNASLPFQDIFRQAMYNVEETRKVSDADNMKVAMGEVDNIGEIMINSEKAEVAMQMAIQLRNKILDAYQEIMRMNV